MHCNRSISRRRAVGGPCRRFVTATLLGGGLTLFALGAACEGDAPFTPPPPAACAYALSTTTVSVPVDGGSAEVSVSTASQCSWTARTDASWLSITAGAAVTGPGTVRVAAVANPAMAAREATLVVADQAVTVRQAGLAACTYEIAPSSASAGKDGASGSFTLSAPGHCSWTATSQASWLVVTAGASGSGNGTVQYQVERNNAPLGRQGTIGVAGLTFTLTQDGDVEICQYSVAPVTFSPCMTSGDLTAAIATEPGCPWTATPTASWITVVSGDSGSGSGAVTFRVSDNWDPPRAGVVEVRWPAPTAGQNLQVAQAGCFYAVSRTSVAFPADGGSGSFDVITFADPIACGGPTQTACLWSASSSVPWITITTSLPRQGDDRLFFTVASNDGAARSGTITVRDKVVQITQAAR